MVAQYKKMTFTAVVLMCLILGACTAMDPGTKAPLPEKTAQPLSPRELFLVKCSNCHEAGIAYPMLSRREEWIKQIAAMATKDLNWINISQMKTLISYYDDHPVVASTIFKQQCGSCHQWDSLRRLSKTPAQWKTMINFMGNRSEEDLTKDKVEIIYNSLVQ